MQLLLFKNTLNLTDFLDGLSSQVVLKMVCPVRNLEVGGCSSKENRFGQSTLLMNTVCIIFP